MAFYRRFVLRRMLSVDKHTWNLEIDTIHELNRVECKMSIVKWINTLSSDYLTSKEKEKKLNRRGQCAGGEVMSGDTWTMKSHFTFPIRTTDGLRGNRKICFFLHAPYYGPSYMLEDELWICGWSLYCTAPGLIMDWEIMIVRSLFQISVQSIPAAASVRLTKK